MIMGIVIKNKIIKNSILMLIIALAFFLLSLFLLIYLNFYTATYDNFFNKIKLNINTINNNFEVFNSDINILSSEGKNIDYITNSNSYIKLKKSINEFNEISKDYPKLHLKVIKLRESLNEYLKTIHAYLSDNDQIWSEIKAKNFSKLKNALKEIKDQEQILSNLYRSKYFNVILACIFSVFVFFIISIFSLFLYFKHSNNLISFIENASQIIKKLREENTSIEKLHNLLSFKKYKEFNDFSDILFSLVADYYKKENSLSNDLDKNIKENIMYKSFNKFALSVLNSVDTAILVTDLFNKVIFVNLAYCKNNNTSYDEIYKTNFLELEINYKNTKVVQNSFFYYKEEIGKIFLFIDNAQDKKNIEDIKELFCLNIVKEVFKNKRNYKVISNDFGVISKAVKKEYFITEIISFFEQSFLVSEFVSKCVCEIKICIVPEILRLIINLIFIDIIGELKIIINNENRNIDIIISSENSKIDDSEFIKYIISKYEKEYLFKVEYYTNNKASVIRYRFLED